MKGSWQRWTAAGLLVGGLCGLGGCITKDDSEDTGAFRAPIQDKYQSPAAGAASNVGTGGSGHPSPQPDQQATQDLEGGGGTAAPFDAPVHELGQGGSGRDPVVREGLGAGLAESYDAAAPQGGNEQAIGGSGQQGQRASDLPQGTGTNQDTSGLQGGSGQPHTRTPGGD